jgi:hypothetical protein
MRAADHALDHQDSGFHRLVVVLGLGALVAVPTERVAGLVADRLSAATGREVVMEGSFARHSSPASAFASEMSASATPTGSMPGR